MSEGANSQFLSQESQGIFDAYSALGVDEKLALLYYIYEEMGKSITPAAPAAANPELAPILLGDYYQLSDEEQLNIMRQIVSGEENEYSHAYGSLTADNQLLVWFAWAQGMGETIVDMPGDYNPAEAIGNVLGQIKKLDFQEQISVLREIASKMGYSNIKPAPKQAETGKTASL
ncbi:orange carotenoid protein [Phormidium tenue FACHB-886]|nr:orange carotenoid protein [Phormidium tenue FACHB-886]